MEPLVSICTTTYCHEKYLNQTLQGFLNQETDFPFEILIHDDASPDGTEGIIREWASRYPEIILPLYETVNQYSQNIPINETFNFPRARGKYIALCEGDDYWTDPKKLQSQVDYLEGHPECTFCFTNGLIRDENGERPDRVFVPYYPEEAAYLPKEGGVCDLEAMARLTFLPTASFLFRRETLENLPNSFRDHMCQYGDLRMKLFLTAAGSAYYLNRCTCVYRENVPTSAFQVWKKEKRDQVFTRSQTAVRLCDDVEEFSAGAGHEGLESLRKYHFTVMAHNAPDLKTLFTGRLGKAFRRLPLKEQTRCALRLMLPPSLAEGLAGLGRKERTK